MNKVELLAPAGDLEKLKWAIMYGADAVYIGGKKFSLRANATNFTIDEMKEGVKFAHSHNAKVYVTVNIVFHEEDFDGLLEYLKDLERIKVDAIIATDLFLIDFLKENNINLEFHLSTQECTLNKEAVKFYQKEGVKRVVLARESSRESIKDIIDETHIDTEVFIHGAMCTCYSGRCMLSNYMTNRDSNRGGCAQICRWNFDLYDEYKSKVSKDVDFAIAPKDLSLLKYIPELIDMGVKSFKIEGRMKSIYYIATIISVYRRVIDRYYEEKENYKYNKNDEIELYRCANRETTPQYFNKFPGVFEQYYIGREENTNQDFLGVVLEYDDENKEIILEQRNFFKKGDIINIFGPNKESFNIEVAYIKNANNEELDAARHPQEIVKIPCNKKIEKNDLIRVNFLG
ncbi:MAG: U32 family peptidase [Bacilli bacterium]|nr:U32 family peptidase [Bacilli bacterium]